MAHLLVVLFIFLFIFVLGVVHGFTEQSSGGGYLGFRSLQNLRCSPDAMAHPLQLKYHHTIIFDS